MKPEKTEAIVLHTWPARERDKLVVFLTPGYGKRKGWAYGARSLKSRFGAALEPLSKVEVSFLEKESEEIVRIESVSLIRSLFPAQQDLASSVAATYLAEMIDVFAQPDDPSELLYRLLDRVGDALLARVPVLPLLAYAEIWVLKVTGIVPSTRVCIACDLPLERPLRYDDERGGFVCPRCASRSLPPIPNEIADVLDDLLRSPLEEFARRGHPDSAISEIRSFARALRRAFLGHELKSHDIVESVLIMTRR
ncbi:MAG: DNA repair protein RecO [Thermoanaerobaculia bacterium]